MNDLYYIEYEAKVMLADTVGMRPHCELAHRRLCDVIWATGICPGDCPATLINIGRVTPRQWPAVRRELMAKGWSSSHGRFVHGGTLKTMLRGQEKHAQKIQAGKKAAAVRWGNAVAMRTQCQSKSKSKSNLIDQTRARARGHLIDENKDKMNPTFTALKLANRIMANETGWHYDNCKVDLVRLKSRSLQTVILPFVEQFTETKILSCWANAVRLAHAAKVDKLARDATAYAVQCFKTQLQEKQKGKP